MGRGLVITPLAFHLEQQADTSPVPLPDVDATCLQVFAPVQWIWERISLFVSWQKVAGVALNVGSSLSRAPHQERSYYPAKLLLRPCCLSVVQTVVP